MIVEEEEERTTVSISSEMLLAPIRFEGISCAEPSNKSKIGPFIHPIIHDHDGLQGRSFESFQWPAVSIMMPGVDKDFSLTYRVALVGVKFQSTCLLYGYTRHKISACHKIFVLKAKQLTAVLILPHQPED